MQISRCVTTALGMRLRPGPLTAANPCIDKNTLTLSQKAASTLLDISE
jgi:hypothetical protein